MNNHHTLHPMEQYHFAAPNSPDSHCQYPEPPKAVDPYDVDLSKSDTELLKDYMANTEWEGYAGQVSNNFHNEHMPMPIAEKRAKRGFLRWVANRRACIKFGHIWVDESYFGPDSGEEYISCSRCGESHRGICY